MESVYLIIAAVIGLIVGMGIMRLFFRRPEGVSNEEFAEVSKVAAVARTALDTMTAERDRLSAKLDQEQEQVVKLNREVSSLETALPSVKAERDELRTERDQLKGSQTKNTSTIADLNSQLAVAQADNERLKQQLVEERELVEKHEERSKTEFENLANKIFLEKSKAFNEQAEKSVDGVLKPLKEKIVEFEKKVDDESKERHTLKSEIVNLIQATDRTTQGATALADAIRGDSKVQGDWGEHLVEMILESAGLVEGRDFFAQQTQEGQHGERLRPDFLVNLPQNKHLIVDAKVSLKAFDTYKQATDDLVRQEALAAHLKSVRSHVDDLAQKHYQKAKGVNAPDWVFMFVAVEPAYILAMQMDNDLFAYAQRKGVVLVTASTLLASLRTVAHIWKLEKQQRNAQAIATEAGKLYDKFVGFMDDFEKVGKVFSTGQNLFETAYGKLKTGPGNVIRKLEVIRELGAAPTKRIKSEIVDGADMDEQSLATNEPPVALAGSENASED